MKHFNPDKPLLLVVDTSVLLHKLHQSIQVEHSDPQFESILKANLVWLVSGEWLGQHKDRLKSIVFVKDTKPYWRSEWLQDITNVACLPRKTKAKKALALQAQELLAVSSPDRTEEQHQSLADAAETLAVKYKGGRKLPNYTFKKIRTLIYRYISQMETVCTLASTGYEADDMAAAIVQTNTDNGSPWDILLLTVDTDWLGLVNPSVTWVCMSGFAPVVRDTIEVVNIWAEKRLGVPLETWRDIWDIKGDKGDASDNLPPSERQLLPVIDLLNPPIEYRYWLKAPDKIAEVFNPVIPQFGSVEAKKAKDHLRLNGCFPLVRYLPGEDPAMVQTANSTYFNVSTSTPVLTPSHPF